MKVSYHFRFRLFRAFGTVWGLWVQGSAADGANHRGATIWSRSFAAELVLDLEWMFAIGGQDCDQFTHVVV